jgi:hypothetical protein
MTQAAKTAHGRLVRRNAGWSDAHGAMPTATLWQDTRLNGVIY